MPKEIEETKKNIIFYSAIESSSENCHYGGGAGYDYEIGVVGKRSLRKDVPTTQGYFVNKVSPVVEIVNVINTLVGKQRDVLNVYLNMINKLLDTLIADEKYSRLMFFTKHRFLMKLLSLKPEDIKEDMKFFKFNINKSTAKLMLDVNAKHAKLKELDKRFIINLEGFVEGGIGVRDAYKQMELASVLASLNKSTSTLTIIPRREYENPECDFNKVVDANRWYFDTSLPDDYYKLTNGLRSYSFGKVERDKKYYGKFTPDVTYSKLYTKTPMEHLDKFYEFSRKVIDNENGYLQAGIIDNLNNRDTLRLVEDLLIEEETIIYSPVSKQGNRPVLIETINPVQMSYRVREFLDSVDILYNTFINREKKEFKNINFYDITDTIFEIETNKRGVSKLKLRKEINPTLRVLNYEVSHPKAKKDIRLMLSLGLDIPSRNCLNSVTCLNTKVWLVTDVTNARGLRYSTIIETDDFTYVQVNGLANLRVLALNELKDK